MKIITIIAEQVTDESLTAALPATGISSLSVSTNRPSDGRGRAAAGYRGFRNATRFAPNYRVDVVVDDDAVDTVLDGISFAYGAGLFSDAEVWVDSSAPAAAA